MKNIHPAYQPDVKEGGRPSLTLVPIGGLANRFYAITSAIAFCHDYAIDLTVVWLKDWGMGAGFHSILALSEKVRNVKVVDAGWKEWFYERPRKKNFWLPYLWQWLAFDDRIYEKDINSRLSEAELIERLKKSQSVYMVHYCAFYKKEYLLKSLLPVAAVQKRIDARIRSLSLDHNVIGIHIRRGDHTTPTLKSPLSLFIRTIEEEIKKDSQVRFYVASDSYEEKKKLKERFGDKVITLFDEVRRDNENGVRDALVELYALSATRKIYGSLASTYSRLAAELANIPLEVLSIDNK